MNMGTPGRPEGVSHWSNKLDFAQNPKRAMDAPLWGGATCGRHRKVFHCPQLPQTFENSRAPLSPTLNRPRS